MRLTVQRQVAARLLQANHVLCDAQLARLGLRPDPFPHRDVLVRTSVKDGTTSRIVRFRALEPRTLKQRGSMLAHLAGTAEVGLMLGADPTQWTVCPGSDKTIPDARYESPAGLVLVEYDAGGYTARVVRDKVRAFQKEGRVIWATSSALRAESIASHHQGIRTYYTPWWEGPAERERTRAGGDGGLRAVRRQQLLLSPR
jgi:hypothetical protein